MKTFKHVSYTWLLAQVFHPLIFMAAILMNGREPDMAGLAMIALIFGFIFSLPAYLLCLAFFRPVVQMHQHRLIRLFVWGLVVVACIITGFLFTCVLLFDIEIFLLEFSLVIPGCIAALMAIACRARQFANFRNFQNDLYETNLV